MEATAHPQAGGWFRTGGVRGDVQWVLLSIFALGVSAVMTQLALMRELLCAFAGNELVLGAILANWLLLTGLGSALGRFAGRLREPGRTLALAQMLVALLPLAQVGAVRGLRNLVFPRGADVGPLGAVTGSFVVLLPYCVVSGFMLALACASQSGQGREPGERGVDGPDAGPASAALGQVYVADSVGSIAGGAVFSFVLVHWLDHFGLLCVPAFLNLLVAAGLGWRLGRRRDVGAAVCAATGLAALLLFVRVDALTTAAQFPGQRVVFRGGSPYGRLVITESAGQLNFIENGLPFFSTHQVERAEEAVHYAMAQRPGARRVLLVSGGVSGTAREILKHGVEEVRYVELDPLIIAVGRRFLPEALADARIRVETTDGRLFIKQTRQRFDVVIMDMPDPSTSQLNRFYTAEFFAEVRRVLEPDGVVGFGLGRYENYISPEQARLLASARRTLQTAFAHTLLVPGGRVFFLASDGPLHENIAARLEQRRVPTRFVTRHYLDGMMTPDRLADLERATAQPAAVNEDLNPVLYFYHLQHWLSQFDVRLGAGVIVAALGLAVYVWRLRAAGLAVFASGFAASALEVVLLLGFQILHGSLYRQLGVIVTLFMAGLAVGAGAANRRGRGSPETDADAIQPTAAVSPAPTQGLRPDPEMRGIPREATATRSARDGLAGLAFAVAALAVALPWLLQGLSRLEDPTVSSLAAHVGVPLVTFVLAALVGAEFPLASRMEFRSAAGTASRLYTADFVGACLGALLASAWLIPVLGVAATCLLTSGLNLLAGLAVVLSRR